MFYGMILSGPKPKQINLADSQLLHLSNVAWKAGKSGHSVSLYAKKNHTKFLLCVLTKQNPQTSLDMYVHQQEQVALQIEGNGEVHITGYYEPSGVEDKIMGLPEKEAAKPLKKLKQNSSQKPKEAPKSKPVEKKKEQKAPVKKE